MRAYHGVVSFVSVIVLTLSACGDDSTVESSDSDTTEPADSGAAGEQFLAVATTYADLVAGSYAASIESATVMQGAITAFLADPTDAALAAAKDAWLAARDDYSPTEAFRLYDGPIDDPEDGPEGKLNAWPMDEAYVDYVDGDPTAGIVNNPAEFPEITSDVLVAANEAGGESNISTGWHAIEFLLWGQDLSADGPGNRPVTDYTTEPNAARRGQYLSLLADQLLVDLDFVADQWAAGDGSYRTDFLADPTIAVQNIFRGIGALSAGELAGERMSVAYETKDQEDEHSCFSDNTNADVRNNAAGIRMVYLAEFPGISGPSPSSLIAAVDPDLDLRLRAQLDASVALAESFPATFEQMIAAPEGDPANAALLAAIVSIEDQGVLLAEAAAALGLEISITV